MFISSSSSSSKLLTLETMFGQFRFPFLPPSPTFSPVIETKFPQRCQVWTGEKLLVKEWFDTEEKEEEEEEDSSPLVKQLSVQLPLIIYFQSVGFLIFFFWQISISGLNFQVSCDSFFSPSPSLLLKGMSVSLVSFSQVVIRKSVYGTVQHPRTSSSSSSCESTSSFFLLSSSSSSFHSEVSHAM